MSCFNDFLKSFLLIFIVSSVAYPISGHSAPMPDTAVGEADSSFCQQARFDRDMIIGTEPDLPNTGSAHIQHSSPCFTPDENLYFVAHKEAQNILGDHASWYSDIRKEFKQRVVEACTELGYKKEEASEGYGQCVNGRFAELIEPYNDKYQRDAESHLQKRKKMADSLVARCKAALSIKRKNLPRDMKLPLAYYNQPISSFPSEYVEQKLDDNQWIKRITKIQADELVADVLSDDCPGNMIYWITYSPRA